MPVVNHFIIVRPFKLGDEIRCKQLVRDGVMCSRSVTFRGTLMKEIVFMLIIMFFAISFIFFGMPIAKCFLVIPVVGFLVYIITYLSYTIKLIEINEEIANISRVYMSNMFSCFWVAEAYEPYLMTQHPKEVTYIVMTAEKFNHININASSLTKKIVGTISLSKHQKLNGSAWIKRLYVQEQYRRKGIATCLLNVAVEFAVKNRYRYAEIVASEYTEGGKELCRKNNFLLKQRYHKHILGPFLTIIMSVYTFPIFGRIKCTA